MEHGVALVHELLNGNNAVLALALVALGLFVGAFAWLMTKALDVIPANTQAIQTLTTLVNQHSVLFESLANQLDRIEAYVRR